MVVGLNYLLLFIFFGYQKFIIGEIQKIFVKFWEKFYFAGYFFTVLNVKVMVWLLTGSL